MRKANTTLARRSFFLIPAAGLLLAFAVLGSQSDPLHAQTVEAWEQSTNERQPPDKIMDAIGLKPGMVIGEVGAGRGRFTVHLAVRVGPTGRVYANDINADGLAAIRDRCLRDKLGNVETILGRVDDPLFPKASLDLVFMVLTYHHLARPVDLLKNLIPSLKPGATVVVIDPDPVKEPGEIASEYTPLEKIEREAGAAGFEIARTETFLSRDNLFVLQVKGQNKLAFGEAASGDGWKLVNRGATAIVDGVRKAVRFDERPGNGIAWLEGSKFTEGTIEFDVRGKDVPQRSFVGIVFNGTDDETWDAVYFRPFNFKNPDPKNAGHSVQYVSHPAWTWQKLRAERPDQFEKPVRPIPDPNGWFHARVVVTASNIRVYVNGAAEPCLEVEKLGNRGEGRVGLFLGNNSGGDFADLKIIPAAVSFAAEMGRNKIAFFRSEKVAFKKPTRPMMHFR